MVVSITQSIFEQRPDMELQIEDASYSISEKWVQRWQLLKDFREDNGSLMMWTYTPPAEILQWIELNKKLDAGSEKYKTTKLNFTTAEYVALFPSEAYPNPISVSSIYATLQYMNAVDAEYLLGCYIDETLPDTVRKQLYKDLGHYVREKELVFSYRLTTAQQYGTHQNAGLLQDPMLHERVIARNEDFYIDMYWLIRSTFYLESYIQPPSIRLLPSKSRRWNDEKQAGGS